MEGGARLYDREVLRAQREALHSFANAAGTAGAVSLAKLEAAIAETDQSVQKWASQRAQAQQEVRRTAAALDACLSHEDADCSRQARALEEAEDWLEECEEKLAAARGCQADVRVAAQRFRPELTRFRATLAEDLRNAAAFLGSLTVAADVYANGSITGGGSSGGSPGAGGGGGVAPSGGEWEPGDSIGQTDLVDAPLDQVDLDDSGVTGPESFRKVDHATMRQGVQRLDEVVLPAVRSGADGDYFARMDARLGLNYEHGYQRVYDAFFGQDSLRLDAGAAGRLGVTNGYHRIFVARELGLSSLPARISRRRP